ncbi:MAG: carboxypeptidase-like regulatory domain-containing protein, partial [Calditrichia bacterium]
MFKKLLIVLLIVTALPMLVYGQSVGKIAGVAKDKSTGEPLPGVNIVLEGTSTGSATDIDGYYVILNVPVGIYTLRASYIGYNDYVVENVRVSAAITTEINLELQPTTLELEEAVVVTAERPLVEKNVTQSISLVTAEQLDAIPVRGVQDIIALQNSVVVQDGNVHIRGGRAEETGYYLDGADVRNPLDNTASIAVVQEAVEELQVLAGGYTAEFGSANAGIIRAELKTGGKEFHTTLNLQTDKFTSPGKKFLDTYSYQHHIGVLTIGGPLFSNKVRYFLAGQNQYLGDDMVRFSKGYRFENVVDTSPDSPTLGDSLTIEYPDGFTPQNRDNRWDFNGTLLFDFSPVRLRLSGSYGKQRDQLSGSFRQEVPWLSTFNQRTQYDETKSGLFTAKLSHVLSPTMLYDVSVSYWTFNQERADDWFDDEWTKYYDSTAVAQYTIQNLGDTVAYMDRWRENENHILLGMPFRRQGDPSDF